MQPTVQPSGQPRSQPSGEPSNQPSGEPSGKPSCQPTSEPTGQPSSQPTYNPTGSPSCEPSVRPSSQPSNQPSGQPSLSPSSEPSDQPSSEPSAMPTGFPTSEPSQQPSTQPSCQPSSHPSGQPSLQPSSLPSTRPSGEPSSQPSAHPVAVPLIGRRSLSNAVGVFSGGNVYMFDASPEYDIDDIQRFLRDSHGIPIEIQEIFVAPITDPLDCIPTGEPSTVPSIAPTFTSNPTNSPIHHPSHYPTKTPTIFPTFSLFTDFVNDVGDFVSSMELGSARSVYADAWLDNARTHGGCSSWDVFALNTIPQRQLSYVPWKLTISSMSWPSKETRSKTCTAAEDVTGVVTSILNQHTVAYRCDENSIWKISVCNDHLALCVDCEDPCTSAQSSSYCSSDDHTNIVFSCSNSSASFDNTCPQPAGIVNTFSVDYEPLSPAPTVLSIEVVNSTTESFSVSVTTDSFGIVYCLAMIAGESPTAVEQVISLGVSSETDTANLADFNITGLLGFQEYGIFCAAQSATGQLTTLNAVLESEVHAVTKCCKTVHVMSYLSRTIVGGDDVPDFLSLSVLQRPSAEVRVMVSVFSNDSDISSRIFPSRYVTFTSAIQDEVFLSLMRPIGAGSYMIDVNITHDVSAEYEVDMVRGDGVHFDVIAPDVDHPPPKVVSSMFSSNGNTVIIKFSRPTNLGNVDTFNRAFSCDQVLVIYSNVSLQCKWVSKLSLHVTVAKSVSVGDQLVVMGNTIKAECVVDDCSGWASLNETTVTVSLPETVTIPSLSIDTQRYLGSCSEMMVDISSSTGSLGRNWSVVEFSLVSSTHSASAAALLSLLNSLAPSAFVRPIFVPHTSTYFVSGEDYSFTIRVCNFMNGCARKTWMFTVLQSESPAVSIKGLRQRNVMKKSALLLNAEAYRTSCATGLKLSGNISFSWVVFNSDGKSLPVKSISNNPANFKIPGFTFESGLYYTIAVTAFDEIDRKSSTTTVHVYVAPAEVEAVVAGGAQQTILFGKSLILDASQSYDKDKEVTPATDFTYDWSCVQIGNSQGPFYSELCPLGVKGETNKNQLHLVANNVRSLTLLGSRLRVTLFIVSSDGRYDSTSVLIEVVEGVAPIVSIDSRTSISKHDPTARLSIEASVRTNETCLMEWSAEELGVGPVDLQLISDSSIIKSLRVQNSLETLFLANLALKPNALLQGAAFRFTLSCVILDNLFVSYRSTDIWTNDFPSPGDLTITPNIGIEFDTLYLFEALLWSDSDMPLTYEFLYMSRGERPLAVQSQSEFSSVSSLMSRGNDDEDYTLTIELLVFDGLGAMSTLTESITVYPNPDSTAVADVLSCKAVLKQKEISLLSSVLNVNSCHLAPNCTALNRRRCFDKINTCGACADGFVGEEGSSNSSCVMASQISELLSSRQIFYEREVGRTVLLCSECSVWEDCVNDTSNGLKLCLESQKKCADVSCSGHGTCKFVSSQSPFEILTECWVGSLVCSAKCFCQSGYKGNVCQFSDTEYDERVRCRDSAFGALLLLLSQQDMSESVTRNDINSLSSLTSNQEELSIHATVKVLDVIEAILAASGEVIFSRETLLLMLQPLNDVSSAPSVHGYSTRVREYVDVVGHLIAATVVVGEKAMFETAGDIRLNFQGIDFSVNDSASFSVARSLNEIAYGIPVGLIAFNAVPAGTEAVIGWLTQTNVSLLVNEHNEEVFNADVVTLRLAYARSKKSAMDILTTLPVVVTLYNKLPMEYAHETPNPSYNYSILTTCSEHDNNWTLTCPDSGYEFSGDCNETQGHINTHCPPKMFIEKPLCASISDPISMDYAVGACSTISYDSVITSCSCSPHDNAHSRRMSTGEVSDQMSFATVTNAGMVPVGAEESEFQHSVELPLFENDNHVHVVGLMLVLCCLFCICLSYSVHYRIESLTEAVYARKVKASKYVSAFSKIKGGAIVNRLKKCLGFRTSTKSRRNKKKSGFSLFFRLSQARRVRKLRAANSRKSRKVSPQRNTSRKNRRGNKPSFCGKIISAFSCKNEVVSTKQSSAVGSGGKKLTSFGWVRSALSNFPNLVKSVIGRLFKRPKRRKAKAEFPRNVVDGIGNVKHANDLVEKSMPYYFRSSKNDSPFSKMWGELRTHSRWSFVLNLLSSHFDLSHAVGYQLWQELLCFFTDILIAAFFLSALYFYFDMNEEDRETCRSYTCELNCTTPSIGVGAGSFFGDACEWDTGESTCSFRSLSSSIWSVALSCCITAVAVVPVSRCLRYLYKEYVFARTLKRDEHKNEVVGFIRFLPRTLLEWVVINQSEASLTDGFYDLKYRGLDNGMLGVLVQSKSDLSVLQDQIMKYADKLDFPAKTTFLSSWGYLPTTVGTCGEDVSDCDKGVSSSGPTGMSLTDQNAILKRLLKVHWKAVQEEKLILHQMQHSEEPLNEIRILRLLFEDLLQDDVASIYESKCMIHNKLGKEPIAPKEFLAKVFASATILWCLWMAIIGIFYFGLDRNSLSQKLWSFSLLTWCVLDVCIFQAAHIIIAQVCIPELILQQVKHIQALIVRCICELDTLKFSDKKFKWGLMLFSSARVVSKFYSSRFSQLLMAINQNVPLRSGKNFTYSNRAIHMLNVHNNESDYIAWSNNSKHWDVRSALVKYASYMSICPMVVELICTFVICGTVIVLRVLQLSYRPFFYYFIFIIVGAFLVMALGLVRRFACPNGAHKRSHCRKDRDEKIARVLGRCSYLPKQKKQVVRRNAVTDSIKEVVQKLPPCLEDDEHSLVASMNQSVELVEGDRIGDGTSSAVTNTNRTARPAVALTAEDARLIQADLQKLWKEGGVQENAHRRVFQRKNAVTGDNEILMLISEGDQTSGAEDLDGKTIRRKNAMTGEEEVIILVREERIARRKNALTGEVEFLVGDACASGNNNEESATNKNRNENSLVKDSTNGQTEFSNNFTVLRNSKNDEKNTELEGPNDEISKKEPSGDVSDSVEKVNSDGVYDKDKVDFDESAVGRVNVNFKSEIVSSNAVPDISLEQNPRASIEEVVFDGSKNASVDEATRKEKNKGMMSEKNDVSDENGNMKIADLDQHSAQDNIDIAEYQATLRNKDEEITKLKNMLRKKNLLLEMKSKNEEIAKLKQMINVAGDNATLSFKSHDIQPSSSKKVKKLSVEDNTPRDMLSHDSKKVKLSHGYNIQNSDIASCESHLEPETKKGYKVLVDKRSEDNLASTVEGNRREDNRDVQFLQRSGEMDTHANSSKELATSSNKRKVDSDKSKYESEATSGYEELDDQNSLGEHQGHIGQGHIGKGDHLASSVPAGELDNETQNQNVNTDEMYDEVSMIPSNNVPDDDAARSEKKKKKKRKKKMTAVDMSRRNALVPSENELDTSDISTNDNVDTVDSVISSNDVQQNEGNVVVERNDITSPTGANLVEDDNLSGSRGECEKRVNSEFLDKLHERYNSESSKPFALDNNGENLAKQVEVYANVLNDIDEFEARNRFKGKPELPEELHSVMAGMSENEKVKVLLQLTNQTIDEKVESLPPVNSKKGRKKKNTEDFERLVPPDDYKMVYSSTKTPYSGLQSDNKKLLQNSKIPDPELKKRNFDWKNLEHIDVQGSQDILKEQVKSVKTAMDSFEKNVQRHEKKKKK